LETKVKFGVVGLGLIVLGIVSATPFFAVVGVVLILIAIFYDSEALSLSTTTRPPRAMSYGSCQVRIVSAGDKKINVIRTLRQLNDIGLKEAKDLIDSAPVDFISGASEEYACYVKEALEEQGAVVVVTSNVGKYLQDDGQSARVKPIQRPGLFQLPGAWSPGAFLPGDYDVILADAGPRRSEVIWLLRTVLHFDDHAADEAVSKAQVTIASGVSLSDARRIKKALEYEGAVVITAWDTTAADGAVAASQRTRRRNRLK